jgi:hypothetical protein
LQTTTATTPKKFLATKTTTRPLPEKEEQENKNTVAGLVFGFPYLLRRERKNAACKGEEHRQVRFSATAANGWREDATATRRIFHQ